MCVWRFAGPANKKIRQEILSQLEDIKVPIAKCGVHAICDKIKAIKNAESGSERVENECVSPTRNQMMMIAKERGIRNFRVLNKEELTCGLADDATHEDIDLIVAVAVTRWKSGWGKKKVKYES